MPDAGSFTWVAEPSGALVTDIPSWRAVTGQTAEELVGDGWLDAIHPDDRGRTAAAWQHAVDTRTTYSVTYRIAATDGTHRHLSVHGIPVLDDDGAVQRFVGLGEDVTDRAVERETLAAVVEHAPAALALTWGPDFVYRFANDRYRELLPPGREPLGRPVGEVVAEGDVVGFFEQVVATGEVLRFEDYPVAWDGDGGMDGERFYDYSLVPIPTLDGIGGVLITAVETTDQVRRRRALEDQLVVERNAADALQRALLPPVPALDGLQFAARYLPGGPDVMVGGDWYDAFALDDGRVAVVVGDVAGRGVRAASTMSQLRAAVRAHALSGDGPAALIPCVERFFAAQDAEMATLLYAELAPDRRAIAYVSAGHPPAVLVDPDGRPRYLDGGLIPPIGAGHGSARHPVPGRAELHDGSVLLLYTDGLVEDRRRPLDDGFGRLLEVAARRTIGDPDGLCDELLADVLPDRDRHDDVALLAVRVTR